MKIGREPSEIRIRKFVIKVDRKTIRKNPEANKIKDFQLVVYTVDTAIECEGLICTSTSGRASVPISRTYVAGGTESDMVKLYEKLIAKYPRGPNVGYNMAPMKGMFQPYHTPYVYDFEDTILQCGLCNSKFPLSKMIVNVPGVSGICPICGVEECCLIEYEHMDNNKIAELVAG
jgi:hypothetical protein